MHWQVPKASVAAPALRCHARPYCPQPGASPFAATSSAAISLDVHRVCAGSEFHGAVAAEPPPTAAEAEAPGGVQAAVGRNAGESGY